jgi:thioredoxin reductase
VTLSYRRAAFARCRAENRRRIEEAIKSGVVQAVMPSEVLRIDDTEVVLTVDGPPMSIPNDAVIVQVGGTAPTELLQKFGIDVVVKRGEA